MSDTIGPDSELEIELEVRDAEGEVIDRTDEGEPFRCRLGQHELPPGLERELLGKPVGHAFDLTLEPEDAFGVHDPAQVISIPRGELPPEVEIEPGDLLPVLLEPEEGDEGEEEEIELEVIAVDDDAVTVDLNHQWAGMELKFTGRVVSVG